MLGAILVATDANAAREGGGILVTLVAGYARLVLGLRVQAGKLLELMTRRARRHLCRSLRTVRSVAGQTTGG